MEHDAKRGIAAFKKMGGQGKDNAGKKVWEYGSVNLRVYIRFW
jgi:hypothetical protein